MKNMWEDIVKPAQSLLLSDTLEGYVQDSLDDPLVDRVWDKVGIDVSSRYWEWGTSGDPDSTLEAMGV